MTDIRKRTGSNGTTYQVRFASRTAKSGYRYRSFDTRREALAFVEGGAIPANRKLRSSEIRGVRDAADYWLRICEKEGVNGREPVSGYTHENYEYRADFIKRYEWPHDLSETTPPDVVAFRSWLLGLTSRAVASKVLSTLYSIMKEMMVRGIIVSNPATGITISTNSRYEEPVRIPSKQEIAALLSAADQLANSRNQTIANAWRRYRPMLYLAVDSGMRPQEYLVLGHLALRDEGVLVDRALEGSGAKISVTKTAAGRRFIELSQETIGMIRHYADNYAIANKFDLVFPAKNGSWVSRRNWQRRGFEVACEKAGLMETVEKDGQNVDQVKYRPYDLRHFFASMLIENKVNLKKIQALMGHANIETTLNTYGHLLEDSEREKTSAIGLLNAVRQSPCGESVAT